MESRRKIATPEAPAAIGPYSQGIEAGGFVFVSGQIALVPGTGEMVTGGIAEQTEQVMRNLGAVLAQAGSGFDRVVKTTIYLADMADFQKVNEVYARFLGGDPPARATVQAAGLPRGALVEIDVVAIKG
ncbi:MAG TPA: RidA family protein [Candidatus Saccharimonadales bacterium]|nr:RidA family protein [Candidatus Saccharimonadales bacterium]